MNPETFIKSFDHFMTSVDSVRTIRSLILDLAVRGRLTHQDPSDEPARELLERIRAERERMVAAKEIRRPKPLLPIDEDDVPYELPDGWTWVRFGDVVQSHDARRKPIRRADRTEGDYPYVGASGQIDTIDDYIFDGTYLMIGEDGGDFFSPAKRLAFLMSGRFWANNHVHVMSAMPGMNLGWLVATINAANLVGTITGIAVPKLPWRTLGTLLVPLPPVAEQRRIVARIEELMGFCDDLEKQFTAAELSRRGLAASIARHTVDATPPEAMR